MNKNLELKKKYKGIEKFICPDKLDMTLVPDVDDDTDIGKILTVNEEGEVIWGDGFDFDKSDAAVKLKRLKDRIEIISHSVKDLEKDGVELHKEFTTALTVQKGEIEGVVKELESKISHNQDFIKDYIKSNNTSITEISQVINKHSSSLDVLDREIMQKVSESKIIGSYAPGSNKIPTRVWHNQVDPANNGELHHFLFQQDSGWIGNANKHFALMMAGEQDIGINNTLLHNGETTNFALDVWLTPYTTDMCTLMDGIYLFDENTNFRIKMHNLDIRTKEVLTTNELHHICVNIDIQKKKFRIFIDGKEVKIYPTINTNRIDLPEKFKLMDKFIGDVASIKIYNKYLTKQEEGEKDEGEVDRNFKQGPYGQKYTMYNLAVCLEAMKAETILNDSEYWQTYIKTLKGEIDLRVKDTIYQQDKKIFDDKLKGQDERLTAYDTGIKVLRDEITSKVDIEDWRTYQAKVDKDVDKISKGLDGVEDSVKSARKIIEDNQTNINSYKASIQELKDALKLTVTTDEYNTHNTLYEQQLKDKFADVNDKIKTVNESFVKAEEAINITKGQIDQYVKENVKTNEIVNNLTKEQATQIERINKNLAEIKILKTSITQRVTDEDVLNILHTNGINATNMFRNATFIVGSEDWEVTDSSSSLKADPKTGILTYKSNGGSLVGGLVSDIDNNTNTKFVLSGMYSLLKNGIPCSEDIKVSVTQRVKGKKTRESISTNTFKANFLNPMKIEPVKIRTTKDTTVEVKVEFTIPVGCELKITKPKFEKGLIASDWSSNTDEILNTLEQKLHKSESEIKTDINGIKMSAERIMANSSLINNVKKSVRYIRDFCSGSTLDNNPMWAEIQVLDQEGNNVVSGKAVTCSNPKEAKNLNYITDGKASETECAVVPLKENESLSYVDLDLGKVRTDIAYIKIWHSFENSRLFHRAKTEISTDGEHWTRIFDTDYNGTYCEDNEGLTLPLNAGASASSLEKRVQKAEQKITPNAIITTITDSKELTNVIQKHIGTEIIKVEKRELGGINLILNSGKFKNLAYWEPNGDDGITLEIREIDGEKVIHATGSIRNVNPVRLKPNQEYIYSCEIMFDKDCNVDKITPLHMWLFSNGTMHNETDIEMVSDNVIAAGKWKRIVYTFKTPSVLSKDSYFRPIIWGDQLKDNPYNLKTIMLKEGSMLTGWEPNPEDFVININDAKRILNEKIDKEVGEVREATNQLEKDMNDTFRDGILTEVEKSSLDKDLAKVTKERIDVLQKCNYYLKKEEVIKDNPLHAKLSNATKHYEELYSELVKRYDYIKTLDKIPKDVSDNLIVFTKGYNEWLTKLSEILLECTDCVAKSQIQEGIDSNKVYMSKEMRTLQDEIAKAKEEFEKSKMQMSNEVEEAKESVDALSKNLDTAFKDGVLDKIEIKLLEKSKADMEKENLDVEKKCTTLTSNKFLGENYKNWIVSIKAQFDASYKDITTFVDSIIKKQKYTDQDKIKLKDLKTKYVEHLTNVNQVYISALEDIMKNQSNDALGKVKLDLDDKAKAMKDAIDKIRKEGEAMQKDFSKEINEAKDSVTNLKDTVQKAVEDNVLQQVEVKLIEDSIAKVKREKKDVDMRYDNLIKDQRLQGPTRKTLVDSKDKYDREQSLYLALLSEAIRKGSVTEEDKNKINLTGDEYTLALAKFSEAISEAIMNTTDVSIKEQLEKANDDMRKKMEDMSKSLDKVIAETKQAKDEMHNEIMTAQEKVSEMAKNLDADLIDGFIDKKEAQQLNMLRTQIRNDSDAIEQRINRLVVICREQGLDSEFEQKLQDDKKLMFTKREELFSAINAMQYKSSNNERITMEDKDKVRATLDEFKKSFGNLEYDLDDTYREISKREAFKVLKSANAETAEKLKPLKERLEGITTETKTMMDTLDKEYKEGKQAFDDFKNTINTTFADGIIERAEARALKDKLLQLQKEMQDIDAQFYVIQNDSKAPIPFPELDSATKAKEQLGEGYNKLSSVIQGCIDSGKVTKEERSNLDNLSRAYASNMADFRASLQQSINKLEENKRKIAIKESQEDLDTLKQELTERVVSAENTMFQTKEEIYRKLQATTEVIGDGSKLKEYMNELDVKFNRVNQTLKEVERENNDSKAIINTYQNKMQETARDWQRTITNSENRIGSMIRQEVNNIQISASQIDFSGSAIFNSIKSAQSAASGAQQMVADAFNGLSEGTTVIDGGCIRTGSMTTDKLVANDSGYMFNGLSIGGDLWVNNNGHGKGDLKLEGSIRVQGTHNYNIFEAVYSGVTVQNSTLQCLNSNLVIDGSGSFLGVRNGATKHKIITTRDFGERALNAVESGRSLFEDDGRAQTSNKMVRIFLSPIFRQTIVDDDNYDVLLTPYGKSSLAVTNRQRGYFDVEVISGEDISFYWVARAEQIYNKGERFEKINLQPKLTEGEQKIFDNYKSNNKNVRIKPLKQ